MDTHFDSRIKGFDSGLLKSPEKNNEYIAGSSHLNNAGKSVELLENQLGKSLAGFTPVSELNATEFTPTAVADRILGFVETAIAQRAGSELEAQSLLRQAKEGIAQGFAEAREILSNLPAMNDDIAEQIDKTESLIFQGLDELQNTSVETPRQQQIGQLISESASLSSQFKQSSQASIQIMTQDGDKVDVSYSALLEFSESQRYSVNQQGASTSYEVSSDMSSFSSAAFEFNVQGNLDEGERDAINTLLEDVGGLANQFFNGDVQAAFNSAQSLGFNSSELKSFALDFQQSTYVEVVQTYQRTEQISRPVGNILDSLADNLIPISVQGIGPVSAQGPDQGSDQAPGQGPGQAPGSGPGPAIDVLSQLAQLMEQAKDLSQIEQPQQTVKSLLSGMLDLLSENINSQNVKSPLQNYIKDIIEHV